MHCRISPRQWKNIRSDLRARFFDYFAFFDQNELPGKMFLLDLNAYATGAFFIFLSQYLVINITQWKLFI